MKGVEKNEANCAKQDNKIKKKKKRPSYGVMSRQKTLIPTKKVRDKCGVEKIKQDVRERE